MSSNQARGPKGPMGHGKGMKKGPKAKNPGRTLKRLFDLVVKAYPLYFCSCGNCGGCAGQCPGKSVSPDFD